MGVCESKQNLVSAIEQHQVEKAANAEVVQLKGVRHNDIIDKAKQTIDAANEKIKVLNERSATAKAKQKRLESTLSEVRQSQREKARLTKEYKDQLDIQRETMIKWKTKIQELSEEIVNIEQERKETDDEYKNNLLSINDSFFKVQGDNVSKLKYSKMSKKFVVFTDKINHLFYYDESGPKFIVVRDIIIKNKIIAKQMNLPWFLVIGQKRSALFAAETTTKRDKWLNFIRKSLGKTSDSEPAPIRRISDHEQSVSLINPLFSVDNELENEMNDKLKANHIANHANHEHHDQGTNDLNGFGQMQSPINIISTMHCGHTQMMKEEEFESNPLKFNYPQIIRDCTIMNNGHTVQVNIAPSNKCTLSIHGKTYELKQFHFHTPSEHTIDSKQYEMEMHLVHINEDSEIAVLGFIFTTKQKYQRPKLELTKSRAHLIINNGSMVIKQGKLLKIMKESDDEESDDNDTDDEWENEQIYKNKGNDFLDQFWDQLPSKKTSKDIPLKNPISFDYLFETSSNTFIKKVKTNEINIDMEIFEYKGSLTTPPYTEGVQWLLSKTTHFINRQQLNKLSACWNHQNNAREVQQYCGRTVSLRNKSSLRVAT